MNLIIELKKFDWLWRAKSHSKHKKLLGILTISSLRKVMVDDIEGEEEGIVDMVLDDNAIRQASFTHA